jgi:hypothetical protein
MKVYLLFFFLLAALLPLQSLAQDDREDVIYLKTGTIYRGTITEQTPNVSYKIEIAGGSVILVPSTDIVKITKEKRLISSERPTLSTQEDYRHGRHKDRGARGYKESGYLFETQVHADYAGAGICVINAYKINQYAIVGLGMGIEGIYTGLNVHNIGGDPSPFSGTYFPMFIYYSGDILKKQTTPFYVLEAGYAMATNSAAFDGSEGGYYGGVFNTTRGGPMGSVGFGMRCYAGRRFVFTISANLDIQYARTDVTNYPGNYGQPTDIYSNTTMLLPSLKIGVGLVK